MATPLVVPFTKMHGAGNDFLVLDNRFMHFSEAELAGLARRFCPRRFGVGADGLLALGATDEAGVDYRMEYFNSDGSRAGLCGNGARCLARFARSAGLEAEPLCFRADAGLYRASVPEAPEAPVRLFVPPAEGYRPPEPLGEGLPEAAYVWTGTDHAVVFVEDVEAAAVAALGPRIRGAEAFAPAGANANFAEVAGPARLRLRTFEKGVEAETMACGTGALAAAVVARLAGLVRGAEVEVEARGGTLRVGFEGEEGGLYLEGPAVTVFQGTLEVFP